MGCWNKTCGLSNLPIIFGEEVYVFLLERNTEDTRQCYTTALYKPLLLPFISVYNDYGGGESSSGPAFELIMDTLKSSLIELDVGENTVHDIAIRREDFGEELFFDAVHKNRLQTRNGNVDFVMFRKDVVDYILENRAFQIYVGEGKGNYGWKNNYISYKFSDLVTSLSTGVDALPADLPLWFRLEDIPFDRNLTRYLGIDTYRYSKLVRLETIIFKLLLEGRKEEAKDLLIEHLKAAFIDRFMDSVRKVWIPGCHEGSQDRDYDEYNTLISAMQHVINKEQLSQE